jgi:hypothetical protein
MEDSGLFLIERRRGGNVKKKKKHYRKGLQDKTKSFTKIGSRKKMAGHRPSDFHWHLILQCRDQSGQMTIHFLEEKREGGGGAPNTTKPKAQSVSMFFVCLSGVRLYFPLVFLFCFLIVDNSLAILIDRRGRRRCRIKPERRGNQNVSSWSD